MTLFGLDFAGLLTGTIFIEQIFGISGLGLAGAQSPAAALTCRWWRPPCSSQRP